MRNGNDGTKNIATLTAEDVFQMGGTMYFRYGRQSLNGSVEPIAWPESFHDFLDVRRKDPMIAQISNKIVDIAGNLEWDVIDIPEEWLRAARPWGGVGRLHLC